MAYKVIFTLIIISLISCARKLSSERFHDIVGFQVPETAQIITDRFENSGPDYGLRYEFKLDSVECSEILNRIENDENWKTDSNECQLNKRINGTIYQVIFSVEKCTMLYIEELI